MRGLWSVIGLFWCLAAGSIWAAPTTSAEIKKYFDTQAGGIQMDTIKKNLSRPDATLSDYKIAVDDLEKLLSSAKSCVSQSDAQLTTINAFIKDTHIEVKPGTTLPDVDYLNQRLSFYTQHLSECRLFVFRGQEDLKRYRDTIQKLSATKIFQRGTPIWRVFDKDIISESVDIDLHKIVAISGVDEFTPSSIIVGIFIFVLSGILGWTIYLACRHWLHQHDLDDTHDLLFSLIATVKVFIIPIFLLASLSLLFTKIYVGIQPSPSLQLLSYAGFIFVLMIGLSKFLFEPPYKTENALGLPLSLGESFFHRALIIMVWVMVGYISVILLREQKISNEPFEIIRTIYFMVLSASIIRFFWLVCQVPRVIEWNHSLATMLKAVLSLLLVTLVTIESFGYYNLALFIVTGILLSLILMGVTIGAVILIEGFFEIIDDKQYAAARRVRGWFGVKLHRRINEIILIKFVSHTIIFCVFVFYLLKIWDVSANFLDSLQSGLIDGFMVGRLTIVPSRILLGILAFCAVLLTGRFISTMTARRHRFSDEQDTQVAVASIITYVFFTVAIIFAMVVAGVNFTGLAIVAGALSVGIGLGLQQIVNNFASGLVLLLEKPIKPGDRVKVGMTEGVVKKIRIRSTQIATQSYEDVIVPNSDMITSQVTNYMFRDRLWRWICPVLVSFDSDVQLVKTLLMKVADENPDILQDGRNKPIVLFRSIAETGLLFELWCVISDVNKKNQVQNDLNFAIEEALRDHGIRMGYPQRDVHIYDHRV